MPCTYDDGGESERLEREKLHKIAEIATQAACEALALVESHSLLSHPKISRKTYKWWQAHKKADADRKQKEEDERVAAENKKLLRERALSKLTDADRRVLGLK